MCFTTTIKEYLYHTTNRDFFAVAGGDTVDIWQHAEQFPRLQEELKDVAWVQLLLGEKRVSKKASKTEKVKSQAYRK